MGNFECHKYKYGRIKQSSARSCCQAHGRLATGAVSGASLPWGDKDTGLPGAQYCSACHRRLKIGNPARDRTRKDSYRPFSQHCLFCPQ